MHSTQFHAALTLMENRFPLGSYRYFPVRVIWGNDCTPCSAASTADTAQGDILMVRS
jgi:hypothetical protein